MLGFFLLRKILHEDSWIVDSVSERIFADADTIIFLDVSLHSAYWRLLKRLLKYISIGDRTSPTAAPNSRSSGTQLLLSGISHAGNTRESFTTCNMPRSPRESSGFVHSVISRDFCNRFPPPIAEIQNNIATFLEGSHRHGGEGEGPAARAVSDESALKPWRSR